MKFRSISASHFFIRGKPAKRFRDVKTGRFVKGSMFRTAFGIKQLPLNHKYYGVVFYAWSKEPLTHRETEKLYEKFESLLGKYLGYSDEDWWFSIFEQKNFEMKLKTSLIGKYRFKIDYKGEQLYVREGEY